MIYTKDSLFGDIWTDENFKDILDLIEGNEDKRKKTAKAPLSESRHYFGEGYGTDDLVLTLNTMTEQKKNGTLEYISLGEQVGVVPFVIGQNKPFCIIIPGGGYGNVCGFKEGFMIAAIFNKMGYNAFVCWYSVDKRARFPQPMDDLATVTKFILDNAEKYNVSKENYGVLGFSAGGHLAASWGIKEYGWKHYDLPKPKCLILCYPVITMGEFAHDGSRKNLLKELSDDEKMREKLSIEVQADEDYPDSFIWHGTADGCVPFENSKMLADKLTECGCKYKFQPYTGVDHGWGLAEETGADGWIYDAIEYFGK